MLVGSSWGFHGVRVCSGEKVAGPEALLHRTVIQDPNPTPPEAALGTLTCALALTSVMGSESFWTRGSRSCPRPCSGCWG